MRRIETGVDKLVALVEEKKRITLEDAARELGVSTVIVQEWADFLEEDALISIEYSLSKVWLVERKLSEKEIHKKEKEYVHRKDAFIRKVETTLHQLDKDTDSFEKMRNDFVQLRKDLGGEIDFVKNELKELKYFDDLKKSIDEDIKKQREEYEKMLHESHLKIKAEEHRFQEVLAQLNREKEKVRSEKKDLATLEDQEEMMLLKLDEMNKLMDSLRKKIKEEHRDVNISEENVQKLSDLVAHFEHRLKEQKHKAVVPLLKMSEDHRMKILAMQEDILKKLEKKKSELSGFKRETKRAHDKLKVFFDKKESVEKLFKKIEADKKAIKDEYSHLISKASAFKALTKKDDMYKYIKELDEEYKRIEKHKSFLTRQIDALSDLLAGK